MVGGCERWVGVNGERGGRGGGEREGVRERVGKRERVID